MNESSNEMPVQGSTGDLSPDDAIALDALIDSGFNLAAVPVLQRDRAGRVASVLGILCSSEDVKLDPALVDVTIARMMQADRLVASQRPAVLTPNDEEAVDAWVQSGYHASKVASSLRPRAERLESIGAVITTVPGVAAGDLVDRTLARLEASDRAMDPIPISRGSFAKRFQLADLASVAALLLIGTAVLLPLSSSVRSQTDRLSCQAGLGRVASALGLYAGSFRDALPVASNRMDGTWWDVGTTPSRSNSANLFTLAKAGFTTLSDLACGGNPHAVRGFCNPNDTDWSGIQHVSYSYRIMGGPGVVSLNTSPKTVLLSDRSPVVLHAIKREQINPFENSPNHNGLGQNYLTADGAVTWSISPVTAAGDNIWLPTFIEDAIRQVEADLARQSGGRYQPITGTERPASIEDQFVGP